MKQINLILFTSFLVFICIKTNAQDTLLLKNAFEVHLTSRSGEIIKLKNAIKSAKAEELDEVVKYFKRARVYEIIGLPFGLVGGFIVGSQLGASVTSSQPFLSQPTYIAFGLIGVQVGLTIGFRDRYVKRGAIIYNQALCQKRKELQEAD